MLKTPSDLGSIQNDFQKYITSPSYGEIKKLKQQMLAHTSNQFGLDASSRLEIYYDMYRLRLLDVLFCDYPKLTGLMGEDNFTQAFLHYLLHHPSTHYSVRPFGAKFSDFLKNFEPFCFKKYYSEMAQFEWALGLTSDAEDVSLIQFEQIRKIPPEEWIDLRFKLHPSVSLLTFEYNIASVWKTLESQKICPEVEEESVVERYPEENPERLIEILPSPQNWLVWRKDLKARFQAIAPNVYFMLEAIHQGLTFSEVCEALTKVLPEEAVPGFVMQNLAEWLNNEVLY